VAISGLMVSGVLFAKTPRTAKTSSCRTCLEEGYREHYQERYEEGLKRGYEEGYGAGKAGKTSGSPYTSPFRASGMRRANY